MAIVRRRSAPHVSHVYFLNKANNLKIAMEETSSSSSSDGESENETQKAQARIREELSSLSFEELMKLKEKIGTKVYKDALLGEAKSKKAKAKEKQEFKRLNKNRPREMTTKYQVPFLGAELRKLKRKEKEEDIRDPRFDERAGAYDTKTFKENYRFLTKIRQKEIKQLRQQLEKTSDEEERKTIKLAMQRLINKNTEERKWQARQGLLRQEQQEIEQAKAEGRTPHYVTRKERRAKELVMQFEELKKKGQLNKHLERRRKKNAMKDRKKLNLE